MTPASASLRLTVVSADGNPVLNARVQAFESESIEQRINRWISGAARKEAAGDVRDVVVTADGFAPAARRVRAAGRATVVLQPASRVRGSVTAEGKPVAGARVFWRGVDGSEWIAETDASGRYEVPDPAMWAGSVAVLHRDFAPKFAARPQDDERRSAAFRMPVDFQLERGRAVRGVCKTLDGAPVANAAISVDGWPFTRSGADGTFAIEHMPSASRFIEARGDALAGRGGTGASPVALVARPASSLRGRVTDGDAAVAGAEIIVRGSDAPLSAITSADGTFELPSLAPGERTIEGIAPGFDIAAQQVRVDGHPIVLRATKLASIAGRVIGDAGKDTGKPVSGFRITLANPSGRIDLRNLTYTGDDGAFVLDDVPAGVVRIAASKRGWEPITAEGKNGVELHATRAAALVGHVMDDKGDGIEGASVMLRARSGSEPPANVRTSRDGRFHVDLPRGSYAVSIERDGFAPRDIAEWIVKDASTLDVTLHAAIELRGVVTEAGAPVVGYAISSGRSRAVTSADGTFTLGELEAGDVVVSTRDVNGFLRDKRTIQASGFVTIDVPSGARVRGRVVDAATSAPLQSFTITAQIASGGTIRVAQKRVTATDGAFDLPGLPAGRLRLIVDADGYARTDASERAMAAGETIDGVEIAVAKAAMLFGTITDESGAPVDGAGVSVTATGTRRAVEATSDSAGHYSVEGVARGAATIVVQSDAHQPETLQIDVAGETKRDIVLRRGATLRGTVVTDRNTPAAGARVVAQIAGGSRSAIADDSGAFEIAGLAQTPFTLIATKPGFSMAKRDVQRFDEPVVIAMQSAGVIAGHVAIAGATSPVVITAGGKSGIATAQAAADGTFRVDGAPVGEVQVIAEAQTAEGPRRTQAKTVQVASDGEVWVELAP